jgi:hypothetical protein
MIGIDPSQLGLLRVHARPATPQHSVRTRTQRSPLDQTFNSTLVNRIHGRVGVARRWLANTGCEIISSSVAGWEQSNKATQWSFHWAVQKKLWLVCVSCGGHAREQIKVHASAHGSQPCTCERRHRLHVRPTTRTRAWSIARHPFRDGVISQVYTHTHTLNTHTPLVVRASCAGVRGLAHRPQRIVLIHVGRCYSSPPRR